LKLDISQFCLFQTTIVVEPGEVVAPRIVEAVAPAFFLGRIEFDFDVVAGVFAIE